MAQRCYCDRCGKEIPNTSDSYIRISIPYVRTPHSDNHLDLCLECAIAFYAVFASKEPVEPKEGTFAWMLKDMPDDGHKHYRREHRVCNGIYMYNGEFRPSDLWHPLTLFVDDIKADDWYVCKDLSKVQERSAEPVKASEKKSWLTGFTDKANRRV